MVRVEPPLSIQSGFLNTVHMTLNSDRREKPKVFVWLSLWRYYRGYNRGVNC
jgi:hypothetical protein